jgi:hypothetical protein
MTGGFQLADGPGQIMGLGHHSTLRLLSTSRAWADAHGPTRKLGTGTIVSVHDTPSKVGICGRSAPDSRRLTQEVRCL